MTLAVYYTRHLEAVIQKQNSTAPILWILGPRQAGKTTMLCRLAEEEHRERQYLNLEDPDTRTEALTDSEQFLQRHKPPLILDEVQHVPALLNLLHQSVNAQSRPGDYWIASSVRTFELDTLVDSGAVLLRLYPLSQREITNVPCHPFLPDSRRMQQYQDTGKHVNAPTLLSRFADGCMPGKLSVAGTKRIPFYTAWLTSYIKQDIRLLDPDIDELQFVAFLQALALRCGKPLDYKLLSQQVGIDQDTILDWMYHLTSTGLAYLLLPDPQHELPNTARTPKLYFMDTGLLCYLTNRPGAKPESIDRGEEQMMENYVISEIAKGYNNAGRDPKNLLSYCRLRGGLEIPLILWDAGTFHPVLIQKMGSLNPENVFSALDQGEAPRGTGAVLSMSQAVRPLPIDNWAVPIWLL